MTSRSKTFPGWIITLVLFSFLVSCGTFHSELFKGLFRFKREALCQDGVYEHEGKTCCRCGAGLKLMQHCSVTPDDRKCEHCQQDYYRSDSDDQEKCLPCRSCSHPHANLEVAEPCTIARNAICRCKKDHYCISGLEPCILCHPCKECGAEGIKVACTATNNTVCNTSDGENQGWRILGIIVGVILPIAVIGVACWFWRKRRQRPTPSQLENGDATEVELQPLKAPEVDLLPFLPDIIQILDWGDVRDIAMRSKMPEPVIASCEKSHPNDTQEQTHQLLKAWAEMRGKKASVDLIEMLQKSKKRAKAEKVIDLLNDSTSNTA